VLSSACGPKAEVLTLLMLAVPSMNRKSSISSALPPAFR